MNKQTTEVTYHGIYVGTLRWDHEARSWNAGAGQLFTTKRAARLYLVEQYLMEIEGL